MSLHKNPCSRSHEIYNFGKSYLGHHYYTHSLYGSCTRVEKTRFLKKYINFTLFTPKLPPLGVEGGQEIYNFFSPYPTYATYKIWLRLAQ